VKKNLTAETIKDGTETTVSYENPWLYKGEPYDPTDEVLNDYIGYVYVIVDLTNQKKYLGKKLFWSKKTLPPLKGKTRKRRSLIVSDWKKYYGSSETVKQLIADNGKESFHREILHFCKTRGQLGYLELYEQVSRHALLRDDYYNGIVQARIHHSHIKNITIEQLIDINDANVKLLKEERE